MKGAWLENGHLQFRQDLEEPRVGAGEALVRVELAGICRTDLELVEGYYPFCGIPGHEFVGRVVACPTEPAWVGERVVGEINVACGRCSFCRQGLPNHCLGRDVLGIASRNGCFAELLTLPVENLHRVPRALDERKAVFTEPLAAALQTLEQVHVHPGEHVLVLGAGKLGQLLARVLRRVSRRVEAVARYPRQAELLALAGVPSVEVSALPPGAVDVVVEATGSAEAFGVACDLVRPRGRIVLKSTYEGRAQVDLSKVVVNELEILGSRCGPFAPALSLLAAGEIDPQPLIEGVYPIEQVEAAVDHSRRRSAMKILLGFLA